ncbi:hypothetical protein CJI58_005430 [Bifidobacteriaceae bacterium NR047]|nr:hypothetical protein [Bifidobacteriaceae bacterium NR047]
MNGKFSPAANASAKAEDAAALKASADKQGVKVGDVVREACKLLLAQQAR